MKIAVSYRGIPQSPGWATGDHLITAFRDLGHDAQPYGRYYSQPGSDGRGREMCGVPLGPAPIDPDLVVWLECGDADAQYLELVDYKCPVVFWDFDTLLHVEPSQRLMALLQPAAMFVANPLAAPALPGSKYLPYAAPDVFFPPEAYQREGAAMIGSPFPDRVEFAAAAGIKLGQLSHADYLKALWRLAIHVHHLDSGGTGLLVMRVFETLASGALLLTRPTPALFRHFLPGVHCCTYSSAENCRDVVAWWLEHEEERAQIAETAMETVRREHMYRHRAEEILEAVK